MVTIPAPTHAREEWEDADFDFPDGDVISQPADHESDKDGEEDWDVEMDLGKTGGAKVMTQAEDMQATLAVPKSAMVTIRPPISTSEPHSPDEGDDDEGISTIKISALHITSHKTQENATISSSQDDDMEADFALPSDLTQLSLRPLSLHHRESKASLEWGDRDHTSSSTSSSEAYSSLGFGTYSSSTCTSASLPGTDDDCDEEDDDLDGVVIPSGLFETEQGRKHLTKILDLKKKMPKVEERVNIASPDPEDDFEIGLVINGDDDLSPSKFAKTQQTKRTGTLATRSKSEPARASANLRPSSRLRGDRPKTPVGQAGASASRNSLSPPLRPVQSRRCNTLQALPPLQQPSSSSGVSKQGVIRNQKSYSVLKSPPAVPRKLARKASLSSLLETSSAQSPTSDTGSVQQGGRGYSAATASSRARKQASSTSRMHGVEPPPSRPSTPSQNPAALRLTMPTSMSRLKSRPSISGIFPPPTPPLPAQSNVAGPSKLAKQPSKPGLDQPVPVRSIRRTKRRVFGDGTELDAFDDLPTDRSKEAQFRIHARAKDSQSSVGSTSKSEKESHRGTIRRRKDLSDADSQSAVSSTTLRHKQSRLEGLSKNENPQRRKLSSSATKRKPTLIRNLGGAGAPKVIGEMRWNPQTLRWEGNDQALRDFDSVMGTSARPALITHLTGSSMGSPSNNFGSTSRVVGNMVFDPIRMCWMSTLPPEEDEPDVFAHLADDEDDFDWESKGGTIRANQQVLKTDDDTRRSDESRKTPSPVPSTYSRTRSTSQSDSDCGSQASLVFDVEDDFVDLCRAAESRHRAEMKGWTLGRNSLDVEPSRSYLYEIRTLATRQY